MEPIFFRRSDRTASSLPEFVSERCDVIVPERGDAMGCRRLSMLMRVVGIL
jgi:hypothetical protein